MTVDNSRFYEMQERYLQDRADKDAWDFMFLAVRDVMRSCALKELAGTPGMRNIDDRVLDSLAYLMGRYKKDAGFRIERLEYMCKMTVYSFIHRPSQVRKDREICIDNVLRKGAGALQAAAYTQDFVTDIERREREAYLMRFAGKDTPAFSRVGFVADFDKYRQAEFNFGA